MSKTNVGEHIAGGCVGIGMHLGWGRSHVPANLSRGACLSEGHACFLAAMGKHLDFYTVLEISKELFCKGAFSEHPLVRSSILRRCDLFVSALRPPNMARLILAENHLKPSFGQMVMQMHCLLCTTAGQAGCCPCRMQASKRFARQLGNRLEQLWALDGSSNPTMR